MPGGRDWDLDTSDAAVTLNYDNDLDLTFESQIQAMKGDSIATAINIGDFLRVNNLNSAKSIRHDPVTTRRTDRNKTSKWKRLNGVKMPSKTWDYVVSHTSSSSKGAIQTQAITIPPYPGRVRNGFL